MQRHSHWPVFLNCLLSSHIQNIYANICVCKLLNVCCNDIHDAFRSHSCFIADNNIIKLLHTLTYNEELSMVITSESLL